MRVIRAENFDTMSNSALNKAISIANGLNCSELNCSHLLAAVITISPQMGETFTQDTDGHTPTEYINALKMQCEKGYYTDNSDLRTEISIEHSTKPMSTVLNGVLNKAVRLGRLVTLEDIYKEIFLVKDSEAYETLEAIGVYKENIKIESEESHSILENMPTTARFASDMCEMARKNMYDPIESRDDVIEKVIEVLGRRQKGNPCLIGEPGVGKTAIIEGLAQRIVEGNVPSYLKDKHILNVDVSGIVSGSRFRGEFEERMNNILYEVDAMKNCILFFDEFHMLMEAGGSSTDSTMTASNILKPAISRGDIKIIGATTIKEYSKFVENDAAFNRRIQSILVDEPNTATAIKMVEKVAQIYENYHHCKIGSEAIAAAVKLSDRYIIDKKLPDKAINVIDDTAARLKAITPDGEVFDITPEDIRETISKTTGIDVKSIDTDGRSRLQALNENIHKHVIGQNNAINNVVKAIRRAKAGIKDPNRPIASFLFVGPTGVGKTELTKAVATEFTGDIKNLIKLDMSEYMEKHSVSKLIGAPPGYVGYGEGGQLTEAVRHNPNSVVLFDEIEKAHHDVFNALLQILDEGMLTDSKGVKVDFKNSIIIMTSNAGYGLEQELRRIGFNSTVATEDENAREDRAKKALEETFRPEFINRIDKIVVFNSLTKEDCAAIANLELGKIEARLDDRSIKISWDGSLVEHIIATGYSEKFGARNIKRKIQELVEDTLSDYIINDIIKDNSNVELSYADKLVVKINGNIVESISLSKVLVTN